MYVMYKQSKMFDSKRLKTSECPVKKTGIRLCLRPIEMFSLEATFWHFLFPRALSPAGTLKLQAAFIYSIRAANCVVSGSSRLHNGPNLTRLFPS